MPPKDLLFTGGGRLSPFVSRSKKRNGVTGTTGTQALLSACLMTWVQGGVWVQIPGPSSQELCGFSQVTSLWQGIVVEAAGWSCLPFSSALSPTLGLAMGWQWPMGQ